MKKILLLLAMFLMIQIHAQATQKTQKIHNYCYLGGALELGNHIGVGLDVNYIYKEKYSFAIGYLVQFSFSNTPDDFYDKDDDLFIPIDLLETKYITIGRVFKLDKYTRLNLSIGVGKSEGDKLGNWKRLGEYSRGYDYSYDFIEANPYSLIINPKIEFPFFKLLGLQLSPKAVINGSQNYYGLGLGVLLGYLR